MQWISSREGDIVKTKLQLCTWFVAGNAHGHCFLTQLPQHTDGNLVIYTHDLLNILCYFILFGFALFGTTLLEARGHLDILIIQLARANIRS
jgi:hypothetical protein